MKRFDWALSRLVSAFLVSFEFWPLQRDLRLTWCGDRPNDVDVDVLHHRA